MEYFVSAEDVSYHHWQLELLIESFKIHKLENKLVLGIAENNDPKIVDFSYNLRRIKRIFMHENLGRKRGYLPLNRPYSLYAALTQGLLTQPFTLIDPDMLLFQPTITHDNISFQVQPLFSLEFAEQDCPVKSHIKELLKIRKSNEPESSFWFPVSSVMVFDKVPVEFFSRVVERIENLEFARRKTSNDNWWFTEKVAWALTLLEYHGHLTYKPGFNYEMTLLDNNRNCNFIHYKHGLPPVFSKHMFHFLPPEGFAMGSLFDLILANNPTTSTNYLQEVTRSYQRQLPKQQYKPTPIREFIVKVAR